AAAQCYLGANQALARKSCRFDVVAVDGSVEPPAIEWIRDAFDAF
ncbi:MAG: YraN family protein, partial [Lysobacteraceae bacterium]